MHNFVHSPAYALSLANSPENPLSRRRRLQLALVVVIGNSGTQYCTAVALHFHSQGGAVVNLAPAGRLRPDSSSHLVSLVTTIVSSLVREPPDFQVAPLLLLLHLITHPTKCYTNSKVRALSEKTNSEQVRLQVFRKSRWTNCQVLQFNRQLIPTAGTSNSKGSRTPIRPVARHNKIPTNSGSQSRPTRDCRTLGAKSNKVSRSDRDL